MGYRPLFVTRLSQYGKRPSWPSQPWLGRVMANSAYWTVSSTESHFWAMKRINSAVSVSNRPNFKTMVLTLPSNFSTHANLYGARLTVVWRFKGTCLNISFDCTLDRCTEVRRSNGKTENCERFLACPGSYGRFHRTQIRWRTWMANDLEGL